MVNEVKQPDSSDPSGNAGLGGLAVFTSAPHRVMFFAGTVQLVAVLSLWGVELAGRAAGLRWLDNVQIPIAQAHGFLMIYGLFSYFMFGFLMTTYPRWMRGDLVPRERYVTSFLLLSAGLILFYVGLIFSKEILILALMIYFSGWLVTLLGLFKVYVNAPVPDKHYEQWLNGALVLGCLGVLIFLIGIVSGTGFMLRFSLEAGLWWFLLPVTIGVSLRMIPFFTSCVLTDYHVVQPRWVLPLVAISCIGHLSLSMAGLARWLFLVDLPLALTALYLTYKWQFWRSFQVRLLAMLHIAFAWLGIAMILYTLQSFLFLITDQWYFNRGPIHALGIGFLASLTIAMASRVSLGHSGRELEADRTTWICFLALGIVATVRVSAEMPGLSVLKGDFLNFGAALLWLVCLLPWVVRYGSIYLRPRIDGKPG